MRPGFRTAFGMLVGATAMYYADPIQGRRRRVERLDRTGHSTRQWNRFISISLRDSWHRLQGLVMRSASALRSHPLSDDVLVARVRAAIGRRTSHPHAIEVLARSGIVTLRGVILEKEVPGLISKVLRVAGVHRCVNELRAYRSSDIIPALQGGKTRPVGSSFELMQPFWAPSTRLGIGGLSAVLLGYGINRRGWFGGFLSLFSLGFFARAVTNLEFKRLTGVGAGRRAIEVRKTININAPLEKVFLAWDHPQRFSEYMPDVIRVKDVGRNRLNWRVKGVVGVPVSWNTKISAREPNRLIAWRTEPGAWVQSAGRADFVSNSNGSTRVTVDLSYNPPGGALGHLIAKFFRVDPKMKLDQDLMLMKTRLESEAVKMPGRVLTNIEDIA